MKTTYVWLIFDNCCTHMGITAPIPIQEYGYLNNIQTIECLVWMVTMVTGESDQTGGVIF